ncbi:MAG: 4-phosphopantetheinyl transferase [Flavobacteriaceae bacterium]
MSVRHLLVHSGYTDFDLYYDDNGKPHLRDGKKISITHSYVFSAIIISDAEVGIDIEMQRPKILKIAHKFTPIEEYRTLVNEEALIRKLTMVWGAKGKSLQKFCGTWVSFLQHIYVEDFEMSSTDYLRKFSKGKIENMGWGFKSLEGFCVYAVID